MGWPGVATIDFYIVSSARAFTRASRRCVTEAIHRPRPSPKAAFAAGAAVQPFALRRFAGDAALRRRFQEQARARINCWSVDNYMAGLREALGLSRQP